MLFMQRPSAYSHHSGSFRSDFDSAFSGARTILKTGRRYSHEQARNNDSRAMHIKLNELIASSKLTSNRTITVEDLDASELEMLHPFYARLAELACKEGDLKCSHSLDDASELHEWKSRSHKRGVSGAAASFAGEH